MPLRVLLVEDNLTIAENLVATLRELVGADVVMVVDGEVETNAWLQTNPQWSLAVVDLFIKNGSGLGVLKTLRVRQRHQRAVVFSNYATADIRARCLQMGADRVFDKSTEIDEFFEYLAFVESDIPTGAGPTAQA